MNPKIIKGLKHPYYGFELVLNQIARFVSDEHFIKWKYYLNFRKKLNLDNPQTYNEKLQWLKLFDRREEYTLMVDKYEAKKYVAQIIGDEYIIPNYGVWERFDDIDFALLPQQFVLKCTHDSGGLVICKDKAQFDIEFAKQKIEKSLKREFYYVGREWPYKNVKPRIIAEKYLENKTANELIDYKLMCFNGQLKFTLICQDRYSDRGLHETFFDNEWNVMPFRRKNPLCEGEVKKPICFEKMKELAEKLSTDVPFLRVDFYEINGKPFFGELTLFPGDGFEEFVPEAYDEIIGGWLDIGNVIKKVED